MLTTYTEGKKNHPSIPFEKKSWEETFHKTLWEHLFTTFDWRLMRTKKMVFNAGGSIELFHTYETYSGLCDK